MIYICSRCGRKYGCYCGCYSEEDDKQHIRWLEEKINHTLPEDVHVCPDCFYYLFFGSAFITNVTRTLFDADYRKGSLNSHGYSSRYNPKCRAFDIKYGFMKPENEKFFDETEDAK